MEIFKKSEIEKEVPELPNGILTVLFDIATSVNIKAIAIVGGLVRDIITKKTNKDYEIIFNDLDIIIEGDAIKYVKELENILGTERVKIIRNNEMYKTSEIKIDGIKIDIAGARKETYLIAGENPIVESSTIDCDLIRRDFSMNAMAIELKENKLIDLFSGIDSIYTRKIDFLHESSVLEDPTRIIRASRYAARLDFNLSDKALKQIQNTINSWPWNWHIDDKTDLAPSALSIRLKMELELLFKSKNWQTALQNLKTWGALKIIDTKLQNDDDILEKISIAKKADIEPLTAFVYEAENPLNLSKRLQLVKKQKEIIEGACKLKKYLESITRSNLYKNWPPSKWTTILEEINVNEYSFILEICKKNPLEKYLTSWLYNWKYIESPINGDDLMDQGWVAGPAIGIEIRRQRLNLIDEQNII